VRASQTTFFDYCYYTLGNLYFKKANYDSALYYYRLSEHLAAEIRPKQTALIYVSLARYYNKMAQPDSALYYAKKGLAIAERVLSTKSTYESAEMLAHIYEQKHEVDSAFVYLKLSNGLKDSLFNVAKSQEIENLATNEIIRELELESTQAAYKSKLRFYGLTALLFVALIVAFLLWRNNNNRRQAFEMLQEQKRTIETQKAKVETTLEELKITQRQLIQSEKMASLGELTAGIAHEIQNPLNFVNNFSEVSKELLVEMKDELETGNTADAKEIAADVIENLEKILHHGKRADAIVKGMLQHSRSSSGQKEATDINKLADEYLRLAYHGLRAKDKAFNVTMKTDFDETIETIKVVPQDIGRVMLNLITNAFYAVAEKKKQQPDGYEPTVSVSTKKLNNTVEIEVADNGNGIPQKVWDKIFQPFFTTKPTGEGTGLGLSLSYDIVKAHGGELKVESKEGLGAVFVVTLPVDSSIPV
jgi:signal transduction histidine kinase